MQLLILLITLTLLVVECKRIRFKMKSSATTRNVFFVLGSASRLTNFNIYDIQSRLLYYKLFKKDIEKYNDDFLQYITIRLMYINRGGIFNITDESDLEAAMFVEKFLDEKSDESKEEKDWSRFFELIIQFEEEVKSNDNSILVFFLDDYSRTLIKRLNDLRQVYRVIILSNHPFLPRVINQTPKHQTILVPAYYSCHAENKNTNKCHLPLLELIHNPAFDRFKFLEETPLNSKNISCLRNTKIVWAYGKKLSNNEDSFFQLLLLLQKFNLTFHTMKVYKEPEFVRLNLLDHRRKASSITTIDEWLSDVLKLKLKQTIINSTSSNYKKTVFIFDGLSVDPDSEFFVGLTMEKTPRFIILALIDSYKWTVGHPFINGNVLYFTGRDANSNDLVNLLLQTLIDRGC